MNEVQNSPACERASELIAFVYNEATESEARDFELHLQRCTSCREEVASFGVVRESIVAWRDEALSGFVAQPLIAGAGKKSALAAFRQFFDLSPVWLKVASGFAVVVFCVLAVLAFVNVQTKERVVTITMPEKIQTERPVEDAVVKHEEPVKQPRITRKKTDVRSRRPLSRAEREQLAADLRLVSDDGLDLLSDRINQ
ncbi:MAG TPA: zf-HC2 domain-containing protein [Pyrinomonadaceae bacterium]|nr:zf-HC2 domain-containing protein [Pyrinomonadaceae bacterium]